MPRAGLSAANDTKKSQSFTRYVSQTLTRSLPFRSRVFFAQHGLRLLRRDLRRLSCRRLLVRLAGHPIRLVDLTAAAKCQRARRHIVGDHRARAHIGVGADLDGGHQSRIRADEGALADFGAVFALTIVIAEDGPRPDVCSVADVPLTDVGEVIGLRAPSDLGVLHLDKIADTRL